MLQGPSYLSSISVGFTTTYVISAYHHWCCEFESRSGRDVQHYVIKVVSNLRQVDGFLRVLWFPPPTNWPPRYSWYIVERGVQHHQAKNQTHICVSCTLIQCFLVYILSVRSFDLITLKWRNITIHWKLKCNLYFIIKLLPSVCQIRFHTVHGYSNTVCMVFLGCWINY